MLSVAKKLSAFTSFPLNNICYALPKYINNKDSEFFFMFMKIEVMQIKASIILLYRLLIP